MAAPAAAARSSTISSRAERNHRRHLEARSPRRSGQRREIRAGHQVGRDGRSRAEDARRRNLELVPRVDDARSAPAAAAHRGRRAPGRRLPEEDAMTAAAWRWARPSTSLDALKTKAALPPELEALNHLLKAQADVKERQITRQAGKAAAARTARSQDLSTLFDKELAAASADQLRDADQHRAERREPPASMLDKIRELAQRQDELLRRQQELARQRRADDRRGVEARTRDADARAAGAAAARRGDGAEMSRQGEPSSTKQQNQQGQEQGQQSQNGQPNQSGQQSQGGQQSQPGQQSAGQAGQPGSSGRAETASSRRAAAAAAATTAIACASQRGDAQRRERAPPRGSGAGERARQPGAREATRARTADAGASSRTSGGARWVTCSSRRASSPMGSAKWRPSSARQSKAKPANDALRRLAGEQESVSPTRAAAAGKPRAPGWKPRPSDRTGAVQSLGRNAAPRGPRRSSAALGERMRQPQSDARGSSEQAADCPNGCGQSARRRCARSAARRRASQGCDTNGRDRSDGASSRSSRANRSSGWPIGSASPPTDQRDAESQRATEPAGTSPGAAGDQMDDQPDSSRRWASRPVRAGSGSRPPGSAAGERRMARLRDEYARQLQETASCSIELRRDERTFGQGGARVHVRRAGHGAVRAGHRGVQAGLRQVGGASQAGHAGARAGRVELSQKLQAKAAKDRLAAGVDDRPPAAYSQQVDSYFKALAGKKSR